LINSWYIQLKSTLTCFFHQINHTFEQFQLLELLISHFASSFYHIIALEKTLQKNESQSINGNELCFNGFCESKDELHLPILNEILQLCLIVAQKLFDFPPSKEITLKILDQLFLLSTHKEPSIQSSLFSLFFVSIIFFFFFFIKLFVILYIEFCMSF
jgi:hypothetical protein